MISNFWIGIIVLVIGFIIAMIIEESRDWITESFSYILSFEWIGELWEFITGIFDNLGEFSIGGLVFGISSAGLVFILRKQMLNPFLVHMGPAEALFWGGATYLGCGITGYLVGKKLFEE